MFTKAALCATIFLASISTTFGMTWGKPGGNWPTSWPKELEPLRKQAWTWQGGLVMGDTYDIPFDTREEFEAAWPQIAKVKTKGAAIRLLRGPHIRVKTEQVAGVKIRVSGLSPPPMVTDPKTGTIKHVTTPGVTYSAVELMLVVDGQIVDLNRIMLPEDTPIIDERFKPTREPAAR